MERQTRFDSMKGLVMKYELTILTLWLIAILTTLIIVRDTNLFTYLAPVYFICMVGSIFTVRAVRKRGC
jgi:L-asparagine transporter-like permease